MKFKLFQLTATAAIFAVIFRQLELSPVIADLASLSWSAVGMAVSLAVVQNLVLSWRWMWILRSLELGASFRNACSMLHVGLFFGQALPSSLGGDAMRVWLVRDKGDWRGGAYRPSDPDGGGAAMVASGARLFLGGALLAAFAAACIAVAGFFLLDRILGLLGPIGKIRGLDELQRLSRGATRVVPSKLMFAKVVGSSVVGAALAPLIVYILGLGAWAGVSLWDCFAVVPAVGLTMMLPISFGGWGVREGVMVALLSALGVVPEKALALSPAQGLILLFASLPGGLLWLSYRRDRGLAGRPHAEDLVPTKPSHRQL